MLARSYRFVQVDVFTDRVFGGNPLAVFLDAQGIRDGVMQQIAREMNLSETVFLSPPSRPDFAAALRIFTLAREVPFAGHPTVGTAWVLAAHGIVPKGAYLVLNGLVRKGAEVRIVSEQGTKMGRQSFIHIRLAMQGERTTGIRVGGSVVPVLEGELRL